MERIVCFHSLDSDVDFGTTSHLLFRSFLGDLRGRPLRHDELQRAGGVLEVLDEVLPRRLGEHSLAQVKSVDLTHHVEHHNTVVRRLRLGVDRPNHHPPRGAPLERDT